MESQIIKVKNRPQFGAREWAEYSHNICIGCSHNCRYCFARDKALRSNLIARPEDWATERIDMVKVNEKHNIRNNSTTTMFPSTHDITPAILDPCMTTIENLLTAQNKVLIVSKPHIECIRTICDRFEKYKGQMVFRFTIGSLDETRTAFYEPGAPLPAERIDCLKYACRAGFVTSVSMEPMLEDEIGTMAVIREVYPYVKKDIWIGLMNSLRARFSGTEQEREEAIRYFYHANSPQVVRAIHERFKDDWKICWKESILREINKACWLCEEEKADRELTRLFAQNDSALEAGLIQKW